MTLIVAKEPSGTEEVVVPIDELKRLDFFRRWLRDKEDGGEAGFLSKTCEGIGGLCLDLTAIAPAEGHATRRVTKDDIRTLLDIERAEEEVADRTRPNQRIMIKPFQERGIKAFPRGSPESQQKTANLLRGHRIHELLTRAGDSFEGLASSGLLQFYYQKELQDLLEDISRNEYDYMPEGDRRLIDFAQKFYGGRAVELASRCDTWPANEVWLTGPGGKWYQQVDLRRLDVDGRAYMGSWAVRYRIVKLDCRNDLATIESRLEYLPRRAVYLENVAGVPWYQLPPGNVEVPMDKLFTTQELTESAKKDASDWAYQVRATSPMLSRREVDLSVQIDGGVHFTEDGRVRFKLHNPQPGGAISHEIGWLPMHLGIHHRSRPENVRGSRHGEATSVGVPIVRTKEVPTWKQEPRSDVRLHGKDMKGLAGFPVQIYARWNRYVIFYPIYSTDATLGI